MKIHAAMDRRTKIANVGDFQRHIHLITVTSGPDAGHWLGWVDRHGQTHLITFKGKLGHCISM
jgi:hypothetical protein